MTQVNALATVLRHRLAELDKAIMKSQDSREVRHLFYLRTGVRKLFRALIGPEK